MANEQKSRTREELLELYRLYNSLIKDELNFFFQSFHFYIGLLSAILAGTLAGVLRVNSQNGGGLLLLAGPALILVLSYIGFRNVQAFYRRFTENWVAKLNLESMLRDSLAESEFPAPTFPSRRGGFTPETEWPALKRMFSEAETEAWSAEDLARELQKEGTTLSDARWTFIAFGAAAIVYAIWIVATLA
jgi:hypothetical protein